MPYDNPHQPAGFFAFRTPLPFDELEAWDRAEDPVALRAHLGDLLERPEMLADLARALVDGGPRCDPAPPPALII